MALASRVRRPAISCSTVPRGRIIGLRVACAQPSKNHEAEPINNIDLDQPGWFKLWSSRYTFGFTFVVGAGSLWYKHHAWVLKMLKATPPEDYGLLIASASFACIVIAHLVYLVQRWWSYAREIATAVMESPAVRADLNLIKTDLTALKAGQAQIVAVLSEVAAVLGCKCQTT
mmetsp:Transcript_26017/g.56743  ORF Transcript_26017/g.56743 Transcript_26017/m.56743 type:complete len:173 (+) Transcript_26017:68-586(+)